MLPRTLSARPGGAADADVIRIGLVGCGGRGTGAARDCMRASDGIQLVALGDVFPDRLTSCKANLSKVVADTPALAPKYAVTDDR